MCHTHRTPHPLSHAAKRANATNNKVLPPTQARDSSPDLAPDEPGPSDPMQRKHIARQRAAAAACGSGTTVRDTELQRVTGAVADVRRGCGYPHKVQQQQEEEGGGDNRDDEGRRQAVRGWNLLQ
jgi:hypothetical protein